MAEEHILDNPAAEIAVGGVSGAILARLPMGAGIRIFAPEHAGDPEYAKGLKRASYLIGSTLGAASPFSINADMRKGMSKDLFKSLTDSGYWKTADATAHQGASDQMNDPFSMDINREGAFRMVEDDLYLQPYEKRDVLSLVKNAPGNQKATSQYGLVKAGLRAGAAFLPSYAFGRLAGRVLGVDDSTGKLLSQIGALAVSARASGILSELR